MTDMTERAVMKLIVCTKTDRVVGLHMLGPHAGEITQGFAVAMKNGATKADLTERWNTPTAAKGLLLWYAKRQLGVGNQLVGFLFGPALPTQ